MTSVKRQKLQASASREPLGRMIESFPRRGKGLARWGNLLLALIGIGGAAGAAVWGGYAVYQRYYLHGPAILTRSLIAPIALGILLLIVGLFAARSAWTGWKTSAVLYEQGVKISNRKGMFSACWTDLASIRARITQRTWLGIPIGVSHTYLLTRTDGERWLLGDEIEGVDRLGETIREKTTPLIFTRNLAAFQQGSTLDFGPLRINETDGMEYDHKTYGWDTLGESSVNDGMLVIPVRPKKGEPKTIRIQAFDIPGLDVLLSILDGMSGHS